VIHALVLAFAAAQLPDYCSLTVQLVNEANSPRVGTVVVQNADGPEAVRVETDQNGTAKACDLPFVRYSITAWSSACYKTVVSGGSTFWPTEDHLTMIVYPCSHLGFPSACSVELRLVSPRGERLANIETEWERIGRRRSDRYGRVFAVMTFDERLQISFPATATKDVTLECTRTETEIRRTVVVE
jgi:hypothetical protein